MYTFKRFKMDFSMGAFCGALMVFSTTFYFVLCAVSVILLILLIFKIGAKELFASYWEDSGKFKWVTVAVQLIVVCLGVFVGQIVGFPFLN